MRDTVRQPPRILDRLLGMGQRRAVACITGLSTAASLLMTTGMLWLMHIPGYAWPGALLIATVLPLVIATVVGFVLMRLFHELEAARRQVQDMATRDSLSGVHNRRHFMELAELEFVRAARHRLDLSVAMLDADFFKQINDQHGHASGDAVLRAICDVTATALRSQDVLARYGGEEFVVLLPQTGAKAAAAVAERVRQAVADLGVDNAAGVRMTVTISVGVGSLTPDMASVNALLSEADKALYRAKANGRNRVERAL